MTTLKSTAGAQTVKQADNFLNYLVKKDKAIFKGLHSTIHLCTNPSQFGEEAVMIAREFKPTSLLAPDEFYLKILRRIGKLILICHSIHQ